MQPSVTWDAVVVGGGPAGAAFALEFAYRGGSVVVLERSRTAEHKVCGEFLSPETLVLLGTVGVDAAAFGAATIDRFRLVRGERFADITLPFRAAALSRFRMDEALLAAAERKGVEVVRGARVASVDGKCGTATTASDTWRGQAIALASGKHNVRGAPRALGTMVGFKLHLASEAAVRLLPNMVQLAFFRGGYLGSCLVESGILSIGWVMTPALLRDVGIKWDAQRSFLCKQSSHVAALLENARSLLAKPVSTAAIPYGFLRSRAIAPNVFPVGDQLAVVPSFTGDGLAIALCSGIAAARAVAGGKDAPAFQDEFVGRLRPQFRLAHALGLLLETPALGGLSVAAAKLLPSVAAKLVAATRLRGFEDVFGN